MGDTKRDHRCDRYRCKVPSVNKLGFANLELPSLTIDDDNLTHRNHDFACNIPTTAIRIRYCSNGRDYMSILSLNYTPSKNFPFRKRDIENYILCRRRCNFRRRRKSSSKHAGYIYGCFYEGRIKNECRKNKSNDNVRTGTTKKNRQT